MHRAFGGWNQVLQLEALNHIFRSFVDGCYDERDRIVVALSLLESAIIESLEGGGLIEKRQVLTLKVLHDLEIFGLFVGQIAFHGAYGGSAGLLGSEIAALTEDELELRIR